MALISSYKDNHHKDPPKVGRGLGVALLFSLLLIPSALSYSLTEGTLTYSTNDNGLITIKDSAGRINHFGFAISGNVIGQQIYTTEDFNWTYSRVNRTLEVEINETHNETYTERIITAYNNAPLFNWTIYYTLNHFKGMKIKHVITNNLGVAITNTKLWYIHRLPQNAILRFNNSHNLIGDDLDLTEGLGSFSRLDVGSYRFLYDDIIDSGFDITNLYVGDGARVGYANRRVLALGISKGGGLFPNGFTVELDPTVTDWLSPTNTGEPHNDFSNPDNIKTSNNQRAISSTVGDNISTNVYNFDIPGESVINGIEVSLEARKNGFCQRERACLYLSGDNGTVWTNYSITKCSTYVTESSVIFGSSSDLWGRIWTLDEINNTNFIVTVQHESKVGPGACTFEADHVQARVTYTPPSPVLDFTPPTPGNDTFIGSTFRVNISSNVDLINCSLEENTTGIDINSSMAISDNMRNCYTTRSGYDGIDNGTRFNYRVHGRSEIGLTNVTETRVATANSIIPTLVLNAPINDTVQIIEQVILNYSIADFESDLMEVFIYGSNSTDNLHNFILDHQTQSSNGTYTYNWTAPPTDPSSRDLYALYHLDSISSFRENATHIMDFSGNGRNGTVNLSISNNNAHPNGSGFFGGGYQFDQENDSVTVGDPGDFSDVCNNGCTFSGWGYRNFGNVIMTIIDRKYPPEISSLFSLGKQVTGNVAVFSVRRNGTGGGVEFLRCSVIGTTAYPVNIWTHIAGTYNTTHTKIYFNGILENTKDCGVFEIDPAIWALEMPTRIGIQGTKDKEWDGIIDEVAIWNRSLTDEEISEMYSLKNGTWYWNVSVQDSRTQHNKSEMRQFTLGEVGILCTYDCSSTHSIDSEVDCEGNDLVFHSLGNIEIRANVFNWGDLNPLNCTIGINPGVRWWSS